MGACKSSVGFETHTFAHTRGASGHIVCCCCCCQVARRKGVDGKVLSMGFGFVETDSPAAAKAAIQSLQVRGVPLHALG